MRSEVEAKRAAMKSRAARSTDCEKMPEAQGQTREGQSHASLDPDNEEMQESETLLGQGEQPREDVTKKEEETGKAPGRAKEVRPDEVRTGRGSASLVRGWGERRLTRPLGKRAQEKAIEEKGDSDGTRRE